MKEWVKVSRQPNGRIFVTVTLCDENLTVRWCVRAYEMSIKRGVEEARAGAKKGLNDLRESLLDSPADREGDE